MPSDINSPLQDTYEIACYIHAFYTTQEGNSEDPEKPKADISYFKDGPNPCFSQLSQGIVLVANNYGEITNIDTSLGRWHILGSCLRNYSKDYGKDGRITKIFNELQGSLKLIEMPLSEAAKGHHNHLNDSYHFYSVTQWRGKPIPPATYRQGFKSTKDTFDYAQKIWEEFVSIHEDLLKKGKKMKL